MSTLVNVWLADPGAYRNTPFQNPTELFGVNIKGCQYGPKCHLDMKAEVGSPWGCEEMEAEILDSKVKAEMFGLMVEAEGLRVSE